MAAVVVNLFAGPGAGKSTTAAGIFFQLKLAGIDCELVREYAKDVVWEGRSTLLDDEGQFYIFAKQRKRMLDIRNKVDVIVTDSPLLLSRIYGANLSQSFHDLVGEEFERFDNINFFVERTKPYNPNGRLQDEAGAREIDNQIRELIAYYASSNWNIQGNEQAPDQVIAILKSQNKLRV